MSKINIVKEDYNRENEKLKRMQIEGASERDIFIQECLVRNLYKEWERLEIAADKRRMRKI